MPNLPIIPPIAPEGFCQTLTSDWINQILALMGQSVAVFQDVGTIVLNQESTPSPEQINYLWYKPSTGLTYYYSSGAWISPHKYGPNDPVASMWVEATPAQIWAFDGGDGSDPGVVAPVLNAGAMWIIDPNYAGRSPMGVGTIPDSGGLTIGVGGNLGKGAELQTSEQVGPHIHTMNPDDISVTPGSGSATGFQYAPAATGDPHSPLVANVNTYAAGQQAMPVLHPVRGSYRIIRSARVNYKG